MHTILSSFGNTDIILKAVKEVVVIVVTVVVTVVVSAGRAC